MAQVTLVLCAPDGAEVRKQEVVLMPNGRLHLPFVRDDFKLRCIKLDNVGVPDILEYSPAIYAAGAEIKVSGIPHATGQQQMSQGSHGGHRSAHGSPSSAHQAPTRSVAFGKSAKLLQHYCPLIKMIKFPQGMAGLQGVSGLTIRPGSFRIPHEVLRYLMPRLKAPLLQTDICSTNEASKVLKLFQVIKVLLRCRPLAPAVVQTAPLAPAIVPTVQAATAEELQPEQAAAVEPQPASSQLTAGWPQVQLAELESDRLEVVEQEATSHRFVTQQVSHEVWQRVPGVVKGRVELQIQCTRADRTTYFLGACEVADDLSTSDLLNDKLQQVAKEALAFAVKNATHELGSLPIKMLLSDGKRFLRVDFNLKTNYEEGMDVSKLQGDFEFSAAYPIVHEHGARKEDSYNGVRLLVSWLWDGPYDKLTERMLSDAWQAAEDRDADLIADDDSRFDDEERRLQEGQQRLQERAAKRQKAAGAGS